MSRSLAKDMTIGSPMKLVVGFAAPLLLGYLFQQLYSFVDTAIVGKVLGAEMLAAVGATGTLNFLILGLCNGMCGGFAIPIAQCFGAKDEEGLRRYMMNAIYLCAVISITVGLLTAIFCRAMLQLMATDASIIDASVSYLAVIFAAIPVTVAYNMSAGILRALGDSKTPVTFIAVASLVNIVLDFLFMMVFKMGVAGAAIATVISQAVSAIGCIVVMVRRFPILHPTAEDKKLNLSMCVHLVSIGLPMGLQYSITAIGAVIAQWSVNQISVAAVAAMTAGGKISMFFACMFDALATTMATYAGQNMGARKIRRITQGLNAASIIGMVYCVMAFVIIYFFGPVMLSLFLDRAADAEVITLAQHFLVINSLFYIPLLFVNIVRLSIQGMGYTQVAMIAGVCEMFARAIVAIFFTRRIGFDAAVFANPTAWILADLFLFPCYAIIIRRLEKQYTPRT